MYVGKDIFSKELSSGSKSFSKSNSLGILSEDKLGSAVLYEKRQSNPVLKFLCSPIGSPEFFFVLSSKYKCFPQAFLPANVFVHVSLIFVILLQLCV